MSIRFQDLSGYRRCIGGVLWLAALLAVMHWAGLGSQRGTAGGVQQKSKWTVEDRKRLPRLAPSHVLQPVEIAAIGLGVPPDAAVSAGKFLIPASQPAAAPIAGSHRRPLPRDLRRAATATPRGFRARAPPATAA